jgi:S-adenosylmethionine-diacylglycerol 3-amino-3-carboxypropyl transferase
MAFSNLYEGLGSRWFKFIHSYKLIYNQCWEDPRIDREALEIAPHDVVMVITSAGCNALDYALQTPKAVHAVDMNPRQNALLALKIAAARVLDYEDFFTMFGKGYLPDHKHVYRAKLRRELPDFAAKIWDDSINYFSGKGWRSSFYFNGTAGTFARFINTYIDRVAHVRTGFNDLLASTNLDDQRHIYYTYIKEAFWNKFVKWTMGRNETLSLLGVPKPQRTQVDTTYAGGIVKFIEDRVDAVFASLPFWDNYFWRVYLTGSYSESCCPEYLKRENFDRLRNQAVDRVQMFNGSIEEFLEQHPGEVTKFVLLDHMDWLSSLCQPLLQREWQQIVRRAAPGARVIWRSGGLKVDYVDPIEVTTQSGKRARVGELLSYNQKLAQTLHKRDRVQTYGSFYIADLQPC